MNIINKLILLTTILIVSSTKYAQITVTDFDKEGKHIRTDSVNAIAKYYIQKLPDKNVIICKLITRKGEFIENLYFEIIKKSTTNTYVVKTGDDKTWMLTFEKFNNTFAVGLCPIFSKKCTFFQGLQDIDLIVESNLFFEM